MKKKHYKQSEPLTRYDIIEITKRSHCLDAFEKERIIKALRSKNENI